MLGADVVVAKLQRLTQAQLEDALGAGGEGDVALDGLFAFANDVDDSCANGIFVDVEAFERLGCHAFTFGDQTEQQVLCPDVIVIEAARFVLREDHDPSGPVRKAFKHRFSLLFRSQRGAGDLVFTDSHTTGNSGRARVCSPRADGFYGDSDSIPCPIPCPPSDKVRQSARGKNMIWTKHLRYDALCPGGGEEHGAEA